MDVLGLLHMSGVKRSCNLKFFCVLVIYRDGSNNFQSIRGPNPVDSTYTSFWTFPSVIIKKRYIAVTLVLCDNGMVHIDSQVCDCIFG